MASSATIVQDTLNTRFTENTRMVSFVLGKKNIIGKILATDLVTTKVAMAADKVLIRTDRIISIAE